MTISNPNRLNVQVQTKNKDVGVAYKPGAKGDRGEVGPDTSLVVLPATTNTSLVNYKLYTYDPSGELVYADSSNNDLCVVLGLSISVSITNQEVTIRTSGVESNSGWNWVPARPIFLGTTGNMTQTAPTGNYVIVGRAITPTTIAMAIEYPILVP